MLWVTTPGFLVHFGLDSVNELPGLEELHPLLQALEARHEVAVDLPLQQRERGHDLVAVGLPQLDDQAADVLARAGKLAEAEAVVDESEAISTPEDWVTIGQAATARAWIALGRGDHDRAVELAREGLEIANAHDYTSVRQDSALEFGEFAEHLSRSPHASLPRKRGGVREGI